MKTYQDFLEVAEKSDRERMEFVLSAINNHKDSDLYKQAIIAKEYDAHRNVTIANFQKLLYTLNGKVIPDNYSSNTSFGAISLQISSRRKRSTCLATELL